MYILLSGYPPFNGNSDMQIFKAILKEDLNFDEKDWAYVSPEGKNLVKSLLKKFPHQWITIQEAVAHPWFQKKFEVNDMGAGIDILNRLKNFRIKGKLEMALRAFLV